MFLLTYNLQAALARDTKEELENTLGILSGKGKGAKGKAPRGAQRKKLWEEVKALRKEYSLFLFYRRLSDLFAYIGIDNVKEAL